jgi:hypothetical protein
VAHYHLSVRYRGRLFYDAEGEDIPCGTDVKVPALETALDLIETPSYTVANWLDCTLEVTDETGRIILTLPFNEAVDEARRA